MRAMERKFYANPQSIRNQDSGQRLPARRARRGHDKPSGAVGSPARGSHTSLSDRQVRAAFPCGRSMKAPILLRPPCRVRYVDPACLDRISNELVRPGQSKNRAHFTESHMDTPPADNPRPLTRLCPHCRIPMRPEPQLIVPERRGRRPKNSGPEWHCDQCGRTFAPDYFDPIP